MLNPGDRWVLARLHAISNEWRDGTVRRQARAEGMREKAGAIEVRLLDGPPKQAATWLAQARTTPTASTQWRAATASGFAVDVRRLHDAGGRRRLAARAVTKP